MTAREAAETFINGNRKDCREWCAGTGFASPPPQDIAARTAAVALELSYRDAQHIDTFGHALGHADSDDPVWPYNALDFLRYMAGSQS